MPLLAMFFKAEMEGVEKIVFPENDQWKIDVVQSGGEEKRLGITVDPTNEEEVPNSKGTANFLLKWEGAKAASTISVVTPSRSTPLKDKEVKDAKLFEYSDAGQFAPVVIFDCRGVEPCSYYPVGLTIHTSFGVFEDVDLSEEWMEASETGEVATVSSLSFEFRVVR
mmetsp:Transcript_68375/g.107733  ORF Transcript_68375/g.107733 Transcript_68375/m.107733 type:complete len:167 (+) Transcript_68375:58-558(+)